MPKYRVFLVETVRYEIVVDAEDMAQARETAREVWEASEDPSHDFDCCGEGVEVEPLRAPEEAKRSPIDSA